MRVIETARCLLEPQVVAHAKQMFTVLSDPAIYEYEKEPQASLLRFAMPSPLKMSAVRFRLSHVNDEPIALA